MMNSIFRTLIFLSLLFIQQRSSAQNWEWARHDGGDVDEYGNSIVTDAAGNVYVAGGFNCYFMTFGSDTLQNPGNGYAILLAKYDPSGNLIWAKTGPPLALAQSIAIDMSGHMYVTGYFYGATATFGSTTLTNDSAGTEDIFLAKYDTSGNVIWAKSAAGKEYDIPMEVKTDGSGNVFITGYFYSRDITFGTTTLL